MTREPSKTQIQVDRLALEGDGVGRVLTDGPQKGQVAFVPYTLPGELVEATLLTNKKNFSRWRPHQVLRSSLSRVKPRCLLHYQMGQKDFWCGGCNWQHIKTETQRSAKVEMLKETLVRLGGVNNPVVHPLIATPREWRYRNKVQVPFGWAGRTMVAGFFSPGTHHIVEFDDCPIQPDESVEIVKAVKKIAAVLNLNPYDEDRHRGWLRHLLVRTNEAHEALVVLVVTNDRFPLKDQFLKLLHESCRSVVGVSINIQPAQTHVILGRQWIQLWGRDRLVEPIAGLHLSYSPASFFQVNTQAAEQLYLEAVRRLKLNENTVVLDLYCGVGAMTLLSAQQGKFAIGVEEASSSIRDANANAQANRVTNVKFVEGSVERVLSNPSAIWSDYLKSEELGILIDPPRSGCEETVLREVVRLKPQRIVYVSCNPATLARDIKILAPYYRLGSVTPVDLFPQTSHIEAVATLEKN